MFDVVSLAENLATSPWFYVVLFAAVAIDAVVPIFPGEVLLTMGGAFIAAKSWPGFVAVVAVGAAGAVVGDLLSYRIGRLGQPLTERLRPGSHTAALVSSVTDTVRRRGVAVLLGARFVPGGRTAATLAAGCTRFPLSRFVATCMVSAVAWSAYTAALGYAGGASFESNPLIGAGIGVAVGLGVGAVLHLVTSRRRLSPAARSC